MEPKFQSECFDLRISDLDLLWEQDAAATGDSMLNSLGFKPDDTKAYMQFRIQHAMPVVAGPTMKGNYLAYHPAVIARSHKRLIHQQLNLEHRIKRYDPKGITRDRIVGAIVGVQFPPMPMGGWNIAQEAEAAPHIQAVAVIFKQAEGVPRVLGDHQSNKEPWNNSIEVTYPLDECGVFIPSTREVIPTLAELPAKMKGVLARDPKTKHLVVGKYRGEQLAMAPGGINGTIHYQGVGMTRFPAEREAEIEQVLASRLETHGDMASIHPDLHMAAMIRRVGFHNARGAFIRAWVREVTPSGTVKLHGHRMEANPENPVLLCDFQGQQFLRSLKSVTVL